MVKVLPAVPAHEVQRIIGAKQVILVDENGTNLACPLKGGWMISAGGWDVIVTTRRPPISLERAEAVARCKLEPHLSDAHTIDVTAEPIR